MTAQRTNVDYTVVTGGWSITLRLIAMACLLLRVCGARGDDVVAGEEIAIHGSVKGVAACITCHGATGAGNAAVGFPYLAGIDVSYLSAQLHAFANGTRQNAIMQPLARLLSVGDRRAVAAYFASLPAPSISTANDSVAAQSADVGAWIATRGRWEQGLPACAQCHGPGGSGVGSVFPPLAGQPASYIASQLHDWKDGIRPPGPMALMQVVASKLSGTEITAVAAYYAQVGGRADGAASNESKK
jgi:cytochrome c553